MLLNRKYFSSLVIAMSTISKNFSQPTYFTFICDVYKTATDEWNSLDSTYKMPTSWISLAREYGRVTTKDIIYVFLLAVIWTLLRSATTFFVFLVCK